tara:strand:+ start:1296 stop:1556 length:261 start_codon:yes stop_codon:yes gene_type:complete
MKGKEINGKPVEQYWTEEVAKYLEGRTIVKVEYFPENEMDDMMWYKRPVTLHLDDGGMLIPSMDDEGNDGGAILTNYEELGTIPVI